MSRPRACLALLLGASAFATSSAAKADLPSPPGYQETCTIELQRHAGEECEWCAAYAGGGGSKVCRDSLGAKGYDARCATRGASVWSELWCKPIGRPAPPPKPPPKPRPVVPPDPPSTAAPILPAGAPSATGLLPPGVSASAPVGPGAVSRALAALGMRPGLVTGVGVAAGLLLAALLRRARARGIVAALAGLLVCVLAGALAFAGARVVASETNIGPSPKPAPRAYGLGDEQGCRLPDIAGCEARCRDGAASACVTLGVAYQFGHGIGQDRAQARKLYEQACDRGDPQGCTSAGILDEPLDMPMDVAIEASPAEKATAEKVVALYKRACDAGLAGGCTLAAHLFKTGVFVSQDLPRAADLRDRAERLFLDAAQADARACEAGDGRACDRLGDHYEHGTGTGGRLLNTKAAAAWYSKSCSVGWWMGCVDLGRLLSRGEGIAKDEEKASALYRAACDGGELAGCSWLGVQLAWGSGAPKDERAAVGYYRRACDGGEPRGCWLLGDKLVKGEGAPKDRDAGMALMEKSCAAGELEGCAARDRAR